jgi:hypothetical protein
LFPPDDERLSLETCRGRKISTWKKWKKCVKLVVNPELPQDARSTKYKKNVSESVDWIELDQFRIFGGML